MRSCFLLVFQANPENNTAGNEVKSFFGQLEGRESQEKPLELIAVKSYRKPTQVGGQKSAKVYERTLVKELGKTSGRNFGIWPPCETIRAQ